MHFGLCYDDLVPEWSGHLRQHWWGKMTEISVSAFKEFYQPLFSSSSAGVWKWKNKTNLWTSWFLRVVRNHSLKYSMNGSLYGSNKKKKVSQLVRDQASAPISEQGMALRESVLWMVKVRHKMMHIPLCKLPSARSTVHGKHRACSAMCSWAVHLLELKCSRWDGLE